MWTGKLPVGGRHSGTVGCGSQYMAEQPIWTDHPSGMRNGVYCTFSPVILCSTANFHTVTSVFFNA